MIPLHITWDQFQPNAWQSISFLSHGRRFRMRISRIVSDGSYAADPGDIDAVKIFSTLAQAQEYCHGVAVKEGYDTDQERRQRPRRFPRHLHDV